MEGRREKAQGEGRVGLGHISEDSCWKGEHFVKQRMCQQLMGLREKQEGRVAGRAKKDTGLLRMRTARGHQVPETSTSTDLLGCASRFGPNEACVGQGQAQGCHLPVARWPGRYGPANTPHHQQGLWCVWNRRRESSQDVLPSLGVVGGLARSLLWAS